MDITTDLERCVVIEKLLHEEETKLKKYDEDHKEQRASSQAGLRTLLASSTCQVRRV